MTNPKVIEEILCAQSEVVENSTLSLYGGDIVIKRVTKTTILREIDSDEYKENLFDKVVSTLIPVACASPPKIHHMRVEDTQFTYTCGVKSFKFAAWVIYNSKDKKQVTGIQDGNGSAISYFPTNKVIKDSVTKYILGNKAHTCIVWRITLNAVIPGLDIGSVVLKEWNHHVLGFANGGKTYRFY